MTTAAARHLGQPARPAAQDRAAASPHPSVMREPLWKYVTGGDLITLITSPVIYLTIVPLAALDAWVAFYQAVCFRAWGITRVQHRRYFTIDRRKLPYLNSIEKLNCVYCSYANGVIAFVREVASRTEQYWCPIRNARHVVGAHPRHRAFVRYGDAARYRAELPSLRARLKK